MIMRPNTVLHRNTIIVWAGYNIALGIAVFVPNTAIVVIYCEVAGSNYEYINVLFDIQSIENQTNTMICQC